METLKNAILDQEKYYHGRAYLTDGNQIVFKTEKEEISIKKCKTIITNLNNQIDGKVKKINIGMNVYDFSGFTEDDYKLVLSCDIGVPLKTKKHTWYYVNKNRLVIWENGLPVYENYDGEICNDEVALADCLC